MVSPASLALASAAPRPRSLGTISAASAATAAAAAVIVVNVAAAAAVVVVAAAAADVCVCAIVLTYLCGREPNITVVGLGSLRPWAVCCVTARRCAVFLFPNRRHRHGVCMWFWTYLLL